METPLALLQSEQHTFAWMDGCAAVALSGGRVNNEAERAMRGRKIHIFRPKVRNRLKQNNPIHDWYVFLGCSLLPEHLGGSLHNYLFKHQGTLHN